MGRRKRRKALDHCRTIDCEVISSKSQEVTIGMLRYHSEKNAKHGRQSEKQAKRLLNCNSTVTWNKWKFLLIELLPDYNAELYNFVRDEHGCVLYDEQGLPILERDKNGYPAVQAGLTAYQFWVFQIVLSRLKNPPPGGGYRYTWVEQKKRLKRLIPQLSRRHFDRLLKQQEDIQWDKQPA